MRTYLHERNHSHTCLIAWVMLGSLLMMGGAGAHAAVIELVGPITWVAAGLGVDPDGDGIHNDGDNSGIEGDNPCKHNQTVNCDDNCPNTPNPTQGNFDNDAAGNDCETCDFDPAKTEPGFCGCNQSEDDSDNDGTPNCVDGCDDDPDKTEYGACGCGHPDTNTDGDPYADCRDLCVDLPAFCVMYENFEPIPGHSYRNFWQTKDTPGDPLCPFTGTRAGYCPDDPAQVSSSWTYGPNKFETWPDKDNGGKVFSGQRSGRAPIFDPYWNAIYYDFLTPPAGTHLRGKTMFFDSADLLCDCDQAMQPPGYTCNCATIDTNPPPNPNRNNFDVHGGIHFNTPTRDEWAALVINTRESWDEYVWGTATDGWNTTGVLRTEGWHRFEIVIHPYTGAVGDIEFFIDGGRVAQGRRAPGGGSGLQVEYLRLGGDPAIIASSTLANSFEELWYDEVALSACPTEPRTDYDGDGDVDQSDFGTLQTCFTGPGDPFTLNDTFDDIGCSCMDLDGDRDVDLDDVDVFVNCASGPTIDADPLCDDELPGV